MTEDSLTREAREIMAIVTAWLEDDSKTVADDPAPQIIAAFSRGLAEVLRDYTAKILHGDDDHRAWLHKACEAFIDGKDMPPPRGKGRTEAQLAEADAEAVVLREAIVHVASSPAFGSLDVHTKAAVDKALSFTPRAKAVMEVVGALRACIKAHKTGRFEPAQAAYESACNALARLSEQT